MKAFYTLCFAFALIVEVKGQYIVPEISMGWGTYRMRELKEMPLTINAPVQLKTVNNFPPYYFYKTALYCELYSFRFGFSWGHYSTGARDYYRDYSGEISVKQLIHTNVYSFPFYVNANREERFNFILMFEPGIMSTKYKLLQHSRVWDNEENYEFSDQITSMSVQPGFKFSYTINRWQPSLSLGYFFDTKFVLRTGFRWIHISKDDSDYADFSGIRVSVSMAYKIGK